MERLQPSSLVGPRTYFIDFDPHRTRAIKNRDTWKVHVSRRLKTLLLTKRYIICAASHLRSPIVFEFLRENPCLLEQNIITPALRSDINCVSHYVKARGKLGHEISSFYSNSVHSVISWDHEFNAVGFRDNMVRAIEDEASLLRMNMLAIPQQSLGSITNQLRNIQFLSRRSLNNIINPLKTRERSLVRRFANLIYYCSGARTVNCETAIKEIDYIDFSIPTLIRKNHCLSEEMVFWKLFVEQVLESLNLPPIPWELLDMLTFDDIIKARTPLLETGFCEIYDAMLNKALEPISNTQSRLSFFVENLITLRDKIENTFRLALPQQMLVFLQKQKKKDNKNIAWTSASFGLGLLGMIPIAGIGFSMLGSGMAGRELYLTVQKTKFSNDITRARQLALEEVIASSDFEEKSILFETVEYINRILSTRFMI